MAAHKTALVTGVGRREGIGYEVCRQLAAAGYRVYLSARRRDVATRLADSLRSPENDVVPMQLDIADQVSIAGAFLSLQQAEGSLHVLVNNAAAAGDFGETASSANLDRALQSANDNLFGTWRVTQAMLPLLRDAQSARVVFVTSGAGSHGDREFGLTTTNVMGPAYAVSKAALNALTALFAKEFEGKRILMNVVCPGLTATFPGAESMGARPVADGASGIVWAATLSENGPTGGFFRDGKELPW